MGMMRAQPQDVDGKQKAEGQHWMQKEKARVEASQVLVVRDQQLCVDGKMHAPVPVETLSVVGQPELVDDSFHCCVRVSSVFTCPFWRRCFLLDPDVQSWSVDKTCQHHFCSFGSHCYLSPAT